MQIKIIHLFVVVAFYSCSKGNYFTKLQKGATQNSAISSSPAGSDPTSDPSIPSDPKDPKDPKGNGGGCGHTKDHCPKDDDKFDEKDLTNTEALKLYSCDQKGNEFAVCHETGRVSATGIYIKEYIKIAASGLAGHLVGHKGDFALKKCLTPNEFKDKEIREKICNCMEEDDDDDDDHEHGDEHEHGHK